MSTIASEIDKISPARQYFRWQPAAWLRVTGADAAEFLQGQFTNDLREIASGGAVYGLWLNQKGKVLADSFVVAEGAQTFWVGSYFSAASVIRERLETYIIADDVRVEDMTSEWRGVTVFGADGLAPGAGMGISFAGRRSAEPHREWLFPAVDEPRVMARVGGMTELTALQMEQRRIRARIPAVPADIGPGELPNEGGLESVAISYTKGCYLGQEVIARLKAMGQVRRRLLPVRGSGAIPALPVELFQGDRRVGELRSAVPEGDGFIGLTLLSLLNLRRDAGLSFAAGGDAAANVAADLE